MLQGWGMGMEVDGEGHGNGIGGRGCAASVHPHSPAVNDRIFRDRAPAAVQRPPTLKRGTPTPRLHRPRGLWGLWGSECGRGEGGAPRVHCEGWAPLEEGDGVRDRVARAPPRGACEDTAGVSGGPGTAIDSQACVPLGAPLLHRMPMCVGVFRTTCATASLLKYCRACPRDAGGCRPSPRHGPAGQDL